MAELYTTAPAARAAEISESTLRLWARLGIVPSQMTASGMRLFELADVLRIARERARRSGVAESSTAEAAIGR